VAGASMFLFAASGNFLLYLVAAGVWGVASGLAGPAPAAYVADLSPPAMRGRVFGVYRSTADCGYILGPIVLGWLAGVTGYTTPLLLTGAMFLCSGSAFWLRAPEFHHRQAELATSPVTAAGQPAG